jgi:16S rRNA (guanine527-N7)-methyltransferase
MNDDVKEFTFWEEQKISDLENEQFLKYYNLIHEYNKVMNLTGIDDREGVYLKHFYDSLTLRNDIEIKDGYVIADVGSGAGFPGVVLAIMYPNSKFHLIEPIKKRCDFLAKVVMVLELKNVTICNKRSEEIKQKYDLVISRAVAKLNILLELCIPILKVNGYMVAMKGAKAKEEIKDAFAGLNILNSKVVKHESFRLPFEESMRCNVVIKKVSETAIKYPRNFSQIKSKPL